MKIGLKSNLTEVTEKKIHGYGELSNENSFIYNLPWG